MKSTMTTNNTQASERGATLVIVAVLMFGLTGIAALAIDLGYLYKSRNELQNAADAAALAAARKIGLTYKNLTHEEQQTYVADPSTIIPIARDISRKNMSAGIATDIRDEDVTIGKWDGSTLTADLNQPNAVRVITRRDDNINSPITTFFAHLFSDDQYPVRAFATAALTGQATAEPGVIELPVGISEYWFTNPDYCNDYIKFYPTNDTDSCAGWHTFESAPSNDAKIRHILENILLDPSDPSWDADFESPFTLAGDTEFEFTGGTLSSQTFDALLTAFQQKGFDIDSNGDAILDGNGDPINDATGDWRAVPLCDGAEGTPTPCDSTYYTTPSLYPDGTPRNKHAWETTVPVYGYPSIEEIYDCSNPNQSITILGFARVRVTDVYNAPDKTIIGQVLCEFYESSDSRGGGGAYGAGATIPNLVQ